jgi:cell wall-associated NlpC family hydrolase
MGYSDVMGRLWAGRRWYVAVALASGLGGLAVVPGVASAAPPAPAPTTTTTTTLPSIPTVSGSLTDGQPPSQLLANAIALSSFGIDDSALVAAVENTQAKMIAAGSDAAQAEAHARFAVAAQQTAEAAATQARQQYRDMDNATKNAVLTLYMEGPASVNVSPEAGALALYAQDYADTALGPYSVLAQRHQAQQQLADTERAAAAAAHQAAGYAARAEAALVTEQQQEQRLEAELADVTRTSAATVLADQEAVAGQASQLLNSSTALEFTPATPIPAPLSTTSVALTWAFSELGKPYVWGATGPATFDCSGLTQYVWKAAGVTIPRVAADQDSWAVPVPLDQLLPGDLVFFGNSYIHHVGIYIGDGLMINAPHTGTVVQVSPIWWTDLAGFGRVHDAAVPVPTHQLPTQAVPAPPVVVASTGPVPSQTAPPPGWKPKPGETTPITTQPGTDGGTTTTTVPTDGTTTTTTLPMVDATTTTVPSGPVDTTTTTAPTPSG